MEDGEALRILFEIAPVRVSLGDVAANDELVTGFADDHGNVAGERAVVGGRDEDHKGIRLHERDGGGVVTDNEMFGDVHGLSLFMVQFPVRFLFSAQFTLGGIIRDYGWGGMARPRL